MIEQKILDASQNRSEDIPLKHLKKHFQGCKKTLYSVHVKVNERQIQSSKKKKRSTTITGTSYFFHSLSIFCFRFVKISFTLGLLWLFQLNQSPRYGQKRKIDKKIPNNQQNTSFMARNFMEAMFSPFQIRRRISIRGCVRPSVRPSVRRSVPCYFRR